MALANRLRRKSGRSTGLFVTRRLGEEPATKSLVYASGYELQFAFELFFAMDIAAYFTTKRDFQ